MLVAVTGGIASGKSVISRRLGELGAIVVDADQLAREVVAPGAPALDRIREEFGAAVITHEGALDRAALGAIVFGDRDRLSRLNEITHPAVAELSQARFRAAQEADPRAVVVYDVPLLAEARGATEFDVVVLAEAPAEERVRRMVELRGMDPVQARARIASQASDAARRALADEVIDTGGALDDTLRAVDALWARRLAPR